MHAAAIKTTEIQFCKFFVGGKNMESNDKKDNAISSRKKGNKNEIENIVDIIILPSIGKGILILKLSFQFYLNIHIYLF